MLLLGKWLEKLTGFPAELYDKLLTSLIALLLIGLLRSLLLHAVWKRTTHPRTRYQWRKITSYVAFVLALLILGRLWLEGLQPVATFLGLLTAGLAIALKDPLANIAGWFFIVWRRPFDVGDRIQIGSFAGDVIDIRVFQFTLMEIGNWVNADQSTGRIVHVPNGKVFVEPQINYSKGWFDYIWNEIPVLITFESDWKLAKELLQEIARSHSEHLVPLATEKLRESSRQFMTLSPHLEGTVITSVQESGVLLTVRHLCEPRKRREMNEAIWEAILNAFAPCETIDFAYPTQRFYDHLRERKPDGEGG